MAPLVWQDSLSTGVGFIDESHRRILELIQRLSGTGGGTAGPEPREVLALLTDYTRRHFQEEEDLMAFLDYPALPGHRAEHRKALGWIKVLEAEAAQGFLGPGDVAAFAREFVEDHILTQDLPFIRWARAPEAAQALASVGTAQDLALRLRG